MYSIIKRIGDRDEKLGREYLEVLSNFYLDIYHKSIINDI